MTNESRSKRKKFAARSSASRAAPEAAFATRLEAAAKHACDLLGVPDERSPIVVACSGGSDSVAALALMRAARPRADLVACYVDHRVRPAPDIARDVRCVRAAAAAAGATFARLALPGARKAQSSSREASLRERRYAALAGRASHVGATCVVTAHHRDDLSESALLALVRGSGIDGVTAMRPSRRLAQGMNLVRPFLWSSKAELERYARARGLAYSADATNDDLRIRRNAIRVMLRELDARIPGAASAIARSVAVMSGDRAALDAATASAWRWCAEGGEGSLSLKRLRALPKGLLERAIRFAVARGRGGARDFSFEHCAAIARAIRCKRGGSFHAGAARAVISSGRLRIEGSLSTDAVPPAPMTLRLPRNNASVVWNGGRVRLLRRAPSRSAPPRSATIKGRNASIRALARPVHLDGDKLAPGTVCSLRTPRTGDKLTPSGRRTAVSLARLLAKEGVALPDRAGVPLLCVGSRIAAVLGVRPDAAFAARPTGEVLEARWVPSKGMGQRAGADE